MRELVIISGKGGTGKTSLTAAFASLAGNAILCDADVDAADLHLLMQPRIQECNDFMGGSKAEIDPQRCTECGRCLELCRFQAISQDLVVDGIACEGCGVCVDLCPAGAIDFPVQRCGEWYVSDTRFGPMVHARLGIAEENSGRLVSLIRGRTKELAKQQGRELMLTDGPPGIGCPVIASITGATALLVVVEPTVSGRHDLSRVADLAAHFKLPGMICVNKFDLNPEMSAEIESMAQQRKMVVVGRIPFDPSFTQAMVRGVNIMEFAPNGALQATIREIWSTVIDSPAMNTMGIVDLSKTIG